MKNKILLLLIATMFFSSGQAQSNLWKKIDISELSSGATMQRSSTPKDYQLLSLDLEQLIKLLKNAPLVRGNEKSTIIIPFPTLSGEIENFEVYTAPIMDKELSKKHPNIQSYIGEGIDNPSSSIRFSITSFGLHLMNFATDNETFYIDPYSTDLKNYIVYNKININPKDNHTCEVNEDSQNISKKKTPYAPYQAINNTRFFREFRLAMSCTPEYSNFHINRAKISQIPVSTDEEKKEVVLSAIVTTLTRVNFIYERDLGIRLNLIANNEKLIHLVHDTNFDKFIDSDPERLLETNQKIIDKTIGYYNYDIGHIFSTGGGGLAYVGSVCSYSSKAKGVTGSPNPIGDPFDVDFVAHEMGHQLGAEHTFNRDCMDSQIGYYTSVEPGSGTSIMAYAGVCEPKNWKNHIQPNTDPYFHSVSIYQILESLKNNNCSTNTPFSDPAPVINTETLKVIPKGTPFKLSGRATDANNQQKLSYSWEQIDRELSPQPPSSSSTMGPNFRLYNPSSSPIRYFPKWENVLNDYTYKWEILPIVGRNLNFTLLVRNNSITKGGQTVTANVRVTVVNTDPFVITNPHLEDDEWETNTTQTITWDIAGTTANGINTEYVNISISTDNGSTFIPLLNNTPNDGSEIITVPEITSDDCRILIEPVGNIYYAVSKKFKIIKAVENSLEDINIYPNPTNDLVNIDFKSDTNNDIKIRIHDIRGKLITNQTFENTGIFRQTISLNNVQNGVYLITIQDGDKKVVKKIIKQ